MTLTSPKGENHHFRLKDGLFKHAPTKPNKTNRPNRNKPNKPKNNALLGEVGESKPNPNGGGKRVRGSKVLTLFTTLILTMLFMGPHTMDPTKMNSVVERLRESMWVQTQT